MNEPNDATDTSGLSIVPRRFFAAVRLQFAHKEWHGVRVLDSTDQESADEEAAMLSRELNDVFQHAEVKASEATPGEYLLPESTMRGRYLAQFSKTVERIDQ